MEIKAYFFLGEKIQNTTKQIFTPNRYIYANPKKPIHHIVLGLIKQHKQANNSDIAATTLSASIMKRINFLKVYLFLTE